MSRSRSIRLLPAAALLASLALGAAACGGGGKPRPDLIFVSSRDGDYEIFEMNADGSRQRELAKGPGDSSSPEKLFYQVDPSWSADGREIAFASRREGSFDIFVMDADGKNTRRVTQTQRASETEPTWSPDGKRIAFVGGGTSERLEVMSADGSGAHRVTKGEERELDPAWSPDGRWIAYVQVRSGTPIRELWLVHPDGSANHELTFLAKSSNSPAWSPDSRRIAFSTNAQGSHYSIFIIGANGKGKRQFTTGTSDDIDPAWSPDGTTLAFSRDGAIMTAPVNGGVEQTLTKAENNDSSPVWNPVEARTG